MTDSLEDTALFQVPSAAPAGTYSLVVVVNGFASNPAIVSLPCVSTGVQSVSVETNTIIVYPNPNKGIFNIEASQAMDKSVMEIYNVLGQQVSSQPLTGLTKEINLSTQPAGLYLYRVISESGTLIGNGKLVIQK